MWNGQKVHLHLGRCYRKSVNTVCSSYTCLLRITECTFTSYSIFMGQKQIASTMWKTRDFSSFLFFCRLSSALHHFSLASSLCWTKLHTTFLAQPLFTCGHWWSSLPSPSRRVALSSTFPPCSSLSVVMG